MSLINKLISFNDNIYKDQPSIDTKQLRDIIKLIDMINYKKNTLYFINFAATKKKLSKNIKKKNLL